ncbi:hypothetical protein ARSEF4850_009633 [Beauveria asiatica]
MITDLITLFETVTVDDRVKAVIVTGAGKAFSAGIDLSMDTSNLKDEATGQMRDPGGTLALAMFNCSKPVIIAYNGLSVGIGMTSTLTAAIRIAPRTGAEFGFPFARIGLTMESCSSFFLLAWSELVDTPKDVLPRAIALAEDIITNVSPMAAHLNRQLIWRNAGSAEGAHLVDSPLLYDMFAGSDHLAFKSSFFNKRRPEFKATLSKDAPRTYPWWKALSVGVLPKARLQQLVLSVFAVGLNAVPIIGSVLGSLAVVLGMALFPAQTVDPWEKLHERVEALIGAKLQEHQVKQLQSKIDGLGHNQREYASLWRQYQKAAPDSKEKLAEMLRHVHVSFLFVLRAAVPEFQVDDYAAAALLLFAQLANLHMTLLSDGFKHGLEWGLAKECIDVTLRDEFTRLTSPGNSARGLTALNARADSMELKMFHEAIDAGEANGLPAELIATWKEAYTTMTVKVATRADGSHLDYISHVKKYYEQGRKQVKPDDWHKFGHYEGKGTDEGLALQAYSEYDVQMLENVLHYAEFWPYMAGDKEISEASYLNLDREIFRGPYVRYSENVAWSETSPAPVTKRTEKITSVRLCVAEDVTSL